MSASWVISMQKDWRNKSDTDGGSHGGDHDVAGGGEYGNLGGQIFYILSKGTWSSVLPHLFMPYS